MGKIEDSILQNYRKSLKKGNVEQANLAVELAKELKIKIERCGFVDYESSKDQDSINLGYFFDPFPYRYDPDNGVIVINKSAINLTKKENRLFSLFSKNETHGTEIKIITKEMIRDSLWDKRVVTLSAIRILIKRLRNKIELNPRSPQVIINFYQKGYLFLGKRIDFVE